MRLVVNARLLVERDVQADAPKVEVWRAAVRMRAVGALLTRATQTHEGCDGPPSSLIKNLTWKRSHIDDFRTTVCHRNGGAA